MYIKLLLLTFVTDRCSKQNNNNLHCNRFNSGTQQHSTMTFSVDDVVTDFQRPGTADHHLVSLLWSEKLTPQVNGTFL